MAGVDLDMLWMALQPIMDLGSGRVVGHEALVRGTHGSPWTEPEQLAAQARAEDREQDLERHCRTLAFHCGQTHIPVDQRLFLNVDLRHADMPIDPADSGMAPRRVAIEISERQPILDDAHALETILSWRHQGYAIVLDDYGTGYASLGTLLAIQPDLIKVDRSIVAAVDRDLHHRRAMEALLGLARDLGIEVVAEGIETLGELRALREMGVPLGQGFLLGRPTPRAAGFNTVSLSVATAAAAPRPPAPAGEVAHPFHEALFHLLDRGVYYVDRHCTILNWNAAAEAITGFRAPEVVGRNCIHSQLGHLSVDGLPLCHGVCPLVHTMADGKPRRGIIWIRHKQGHVVAASVCTSPVRDASQGIIGAVEVFEPVDGPLPCPSPAHIPTGR